MSSCESADRATIGSASSRKRQPEEISGEVQPAGASEPPVGFDHRPDAEVPRDETILGLVTTWLNLDEQKRALDAELDDVKAQLALAEERALTAIENGRADGVNFEGVKVNGRSIYISTDFWPKAVDNNKPALCAALKAEGLEQYVKEDFNTQSLRGYTNECIRNYRALLPVEERVNLNPVDALPQRLRGKLDFSVVTHLKSRKA